MLDAIEILRAVASRLDNEYSDVYTLTGRAVGDIIREEIEKAEQADEELQARLEVERQS